jgi:Holliday junction resolvase RusA-like endonuclease
MKINLSLPSVEPLTLNTCTKYRVQGGRYVKAYKSDSYKELEKLINVYLKMPVNKKQIDVFNREYDQTRHYLTLEFRFYYPIITKKNCISKTSKDISNLVKPIEDIIFDHLVCDDSQVINLSAIKIHSEDIKTIVELRAFNLSLL